MSGELPESLPETFTSRQAAGAGLNTHALSALLKAGAAEQIARGIYRRPGAEWADPDMLEIAIRAPMATICLETALARHDLSDLIPGRLDFALPRGQARPADPPIPVRWHAFARETFAVGRDLIRLDSAVSIGMYSAERCIIDALRIPAAGREVAYQAIRRYLEKPGGTPTPLLAMARDHFPRMTRELHRIMEITLS